MKSKLLVSLLAAGSLALVGTLTAQTPAAPKLTFPQASPPATLKQQVGITDIEVVYSRPSAKGRKIFGGLVPYGEIWRTGANSATRISFSTPVKVGGADLPAGNYELFTIPTENEWTFIFQSLKDRPQWGTYAYDQKNDTARATAKPVATPRPTETFAITLSDLSDNGATLNLYWENIRVPLPITIDTKGILVPQIAAALQEPGTPNPMMLFSAAMYYYENNLDLHKALEWINTAIAGRPGQMWMIYRKGLILAKLGDKAGAKAAAEESLALTEKAPAGGLRDEYMRLNQALLERLK
ncbi:MAG: hypothetical protein C0518_01105 [Opitutus sp.]|nr:hypothetical protein [Opitutus sp.]